MHTDFDSWLAEDAGRTLDSAADAPRGLYERLIFVADLVNDLGDEPSGPMLVYRDDTGTSRCAEISEVLTVGREAPAGLVVSAQRLSRLHFTLRRSADGMRVEDMGSRNGVFVNGQKIVVYYLKDGDIIEAGGIVFAYLAAKDTAA